MAAVVRMLDPVGIAAPAVRTAISRMVMQGWLEPVQLRRRARLPHHRARQPAPRRGRQPGLPARRSRRGTATGTWPSSTPPDDPRGAGPAAGRPDLPRVRRARRQRLGQPVPARRARRRCSSARARPRGSPGPTGSTPSRPAPGTSTGCARRTPAGWRPPTTWSSSTWPRTTTRTRRRSRPASTWSTSGASSSSPTRACPTRCCPTTGRATRRPQLFATEANRLKPGTDRFVARCLGA